MEPADRLPEGVPGRARPVADRDENGRVISGPGTTALASYAAKIKQEHRQLAKLMGLKEVPEDHPMAPYLRMARDWRDAHASTLAATVGGGMVGPGPASILATAAMQLAASRWLHDLAIETGDASLFAASSKLGNDSRQNLLAVHELCAQEAKARPKKKEDDFFS